MCLSFADETGTKGLLRWDECKQHVANVLTHHTWVGANTAYDLGVIVHEFPEFQPLVWQAYEEDRVRDIQLEAKLDDIRDGESTKRSYALGTLVHKYLGIERDKSTWRLGYGKLRHVPIRDWPEGARQYPLDDADDPLRLILEGHIEGGVDKYQQARHGWWAHLMGVWGVRTDPVRVAALKDKLLQERDQLLTHLIAAKIIRTNGTQDVKATKQRVLDAYNQNGLQQIFTEKGNLCTNAEVCRDSGDPVLEMVARFASNRKKLSSDIPNLERGEIHTKYDSLKDTGRMGSGGDDPTSPTGKASNLTNIPRKGGIRECYVPRPGKVFFDADYEALEAHTGAQACKWLVGESSLADLLNAKEDYHIHTASPYLGIEYAAGMARYQGGESLIKKLRQFCKIFNYSLAGGGGKPMIYHHAQTELKKEDEFELARSLTRQDSDRLWEVWRARYPEWKKYFDRTSAMTRSGGCQFEQLVSGRVRGVIGKGAYTEMNNGYFQGLGADVAKDAGWNISRECYDETRCSILFGSRLVIFGHDSFTGETDPEGAHDVAMRVGQIMVGVSDKWCPDVRLKTIPCLATCLSKGAKDIYDAHGRLLPWSPKE